MRRFTFLAGPLCLALGLITGGCDDDDNNPVTPEEPTSLEAAPLTGANVVPPNDSAASGTATLEIDGTVARYRVDLQSIADVESATIHSGTVDVNGPVRVTLFAGPTTGALDGVLVDSSFTAADVDGITFDELMAEMQSGHAYVSVGTVEFPDGELRAQIEVME